MAESATAIKLYNLPQRSPSRPRIYCSPNGDDEGWVEFDHLDGMYSYCVAFDRFGSKLGVAHLKAWTPLEPFKDGYRIAGDDA